jgi:hypothetical protein
MAVSQFQYQLDTETQTKYFQEGDHIYPTTPAPGHHLSTGFLFPSLASSHQIFGPHV